MKKVAGAHSAANAAYPLWGYYYGDEPEIGEHFKVSAELSPSEIATVLKYCWFTPSKPFSRLKTPFWSIWMEPFVVNPCDEEYMREIST